MPDSTKPTVKSFPNDSALLWFYVVVRKIVLRYIGSTQCLVCTQDQKIYYR